MRDPVLHRTHRNPIYFIPEFDFLIYKMLVPNESAFEPNFIRQNQAFIQVINMKISGLYHPIEKSIVNEIIAHGLPNNNIDLLIKILEEQDFDNMLPLVLLDNLLHHILIFPLNFAMAINNTENLLSPHLCRINGIQAVTSGGQVQHNAPMYFVMIIGDCFDEGMAGRVIRKGGFQGLQAEVVYLGQGVLNGFCVLLLFLQHWRNYKLQLLQELGSQDGLQMSIIFPKVGYGQIFTIQQLEQYYYFNRMTFKQEYLHRNGPFAVDFAGERVSVKNKIMQIVRSLHPNQWGVRGFQPLQFFESFKQIYGLYSEQLTEIIAQFLGYLKNPHLSCEASILIMKTLVDLKEYKISLSETFKFDNKYFIEKLKEFITYGTPFSLKNSDSYMENLIKLIRSYAKYGQEHFDEIIKLAIQERDIKYIAIFIKSIKSEEKAQKILQYIFEESSLFDRDIPFFYIISELTLDFPFLNLSQFHQTLSQEIIKAITTVVDPASEDELKKLTNDDTEIGVQCVLKSIAKILVNCLKPMGEPGWEKQWSNAERIFSIIAGLVDHTHEVECMNDFLIFMKEFVKVFQSRYRKEKGLHKEVNEDFIQEYTDVPSEKPVICDKYLELFHEIWMPLIPELLYFEDGEVLSAKILSDLAMLWPQKYLTFILDSIKVYLQKDVTICSTYTSKMTILFLQEFIISKYSGHHQFTLLIQCCQSLLDALEVLGVSENLDILELVMRNYMYFSQNLLEEKQVLQGLTDDIITIIEANLEPMSINLESTQGEDAELYIDFKNIFFNFIVRLSPQQISSMCDKLLYKIKTMVPGHRQAYEFVLICLAYKQPEFPKKILDYVYKQVVTPSSQQQGTNGTVQPKTISTQIAEQILPQYLNFSLATKNQENLKWYTSLIQCAFQYNPENVVSQWAKLQTIITLLLREFDTPNLFDYGLDVLFNIIINLEHVHLEPRQFYRNQNRNYQTMGKVNWIHPTIQCIGLLEYIKKTFYDQISIYMQKKYGEILETSQKAQKIKSQKTIQLTLDRSDTTIGPKPIQVKEFINELLDCLLVPSAPSPSDIQERKNLNKLLSIQYSVFSALQMRSEFTASTDMFQIQSVFIKQIGSFRKKAIEHLKWVLQLLAHYNCLYDQTTLKLFHFFWRQAHDELYFSTGIAATNEKLSPYFYPTSHKHKQIFENSFLIMTECYLTFMMRIQLFSMLQPMAYLNNPQFLEYMVPFCFSSYLDCGLKSYVPAHVDPHGEFHFQVLNISRLKLCLYSSNSYIRRFIVYSKAGGEGLNKSQKQKYLGAMRVVISNYKRSMGIFLYPCCIRDETSWYGIHQTLQTSQYFEKKTDKVAIIETIYLLIVFSFDFKGNQIYKAEIRALQNGLVQLGKQDLAMMQKIVSYIKFLIQKINAEIIKKFYEKDATVLVLLLVCFSEFVPLQHEIYQQIIPLVFQIMMKDTQDMMNMGKSFFFRLLNRYIKKKIRIQTEKNTPVKRVYEDFRIFRHIGGRTIEGTKHPPINLITSKSDNYYYPLHELQYLYRTPLDPTKANQALLLSKISTEESLRALFKALLIDNELKSQESEVDLTYLSEEEPKRIYSNGHKLINFILDNNPKKLDIFQSFIDNFSNYPVCFYHRLFRKMLILGGQQNVKIWQKLAKQYIKSSQKQQVKLCQFLLAQLLPFCFDDEEFYQFYVNFIANCTNEEFQFANSCLLVTFCVDWKISKIIFNKIIGTMRAQKGPSRLRHFELFNNYLLCAGRFAQEEAKDGIQYLMGGIEEGSDEVSELIVSMLIYCFIIPINLKLLKTWTFETVTEIIQKGRIYKLDQNTGYEINQSVRLIVREIVNKISQQKHMQSKNLMIYSKIAYKILSNITVHRFNDEFYRIFKDMMLYIVNKPAEEGGFDQEIVNQLKGSQYPQKIYQDLLKELNNMEGNTINVIKKKLRYIESVVINRIYRSDEVSIPDIFSSINEKNITIDHIVAVSNMARIMKGRQLTAEIEKIMKNEDKSTKNLKFLMAYLLTAGTRDFEWRERVLNNILSYKKHKIVKEFVSYWWKGRNPQTDKEQRLCMLVRSVENPYSYFA